MQKNEAFPSGQAFCAIAPLSDSCRERSMALNRLRRMARKESGEVRFAGTWMKSTAHRESNGGRDVHAGESLFV